MLETVKTLCALSGASGAEDEVRSFIINAAKPHADEIKTDAMGNVMVFKKGKRTPENRVMICAHMDEVGLIVTNIEDDGFLRFDCVGGFDRRVLIGRKVFVGDEKIPGVTGTKPIHLVSKADEDKPPKVEDMYIDIGAKNKEEAEKLVHLGDVAVFDGTIYEFGEGWLKAKALDDRVGCAAMLKLLEKELAVDTWFVFTVQEEVGARGANAAAYRIEPDIALILEGTTAADIPGVEEGKRICSPGKGAVIPFMDKGSIYDRELYAELTKLADENGIRWQTKNRIAGGTDSSAIQRSRAGVRTAAVSCAIRNIHSPVSTAKTEDMEALLKLAEIFIENVK